MAKAPFPIDPALTQIAIAYRNPLYIADQVFPRTNVAKQQFLYRLYNKSERYTIPDTKVGRKSTPNEVEFGYTEPTGSAEDYALDDVIPIADIQNAGMGVNLQGNAVEALQDLIDLDRELRVATAAFATANYLTANKVTLSGTDQWSDHANSDPIDDIETALDTPLIRPNIGVFGLATWRQLSTHPDIVTGVHGVTAAAGKVTEMQVADLFGLDQVIVGRAKYNSAAKGLTEVYGNVWGKHAAFHHRNLAATTQRGVTFALTAQWGNRFAGQMNEPKTGARGSIRVRTGESVDELIVASDAGYLIIDAVA